MGEPWRPSVPDYMGVAKSRRIRRDTGAVRLQNLSNLMGGHFTAWFFWVIAVAAGGPLSVYWLDPAVGGVSILLSGCLAVGSILLYMALARTHVELNGNYVYIRNPLKVHVIPMWSVSGVDDGVLGIPRLTTPERAYFLVGLEESLHLTMAGGSEDRAILEVEINAWTSGDGRPEVTADVEGTARSECAFMDRGLMILLGAWLLHAGSFFFLLF